MNNKQSWDMAALFMICLIISTPFISSNALAASVDITVNHGEEGIENYIDGKGDIWDVEAVVSNLPADTVVDSSQMEISLGSNKDNFDTCSQSGTGYVCKYQSDLSSGAIEDNYNLQAKYLPTGDGDPSFISVDSSSPSITSALEVAQNSQGQITARFIVQDEPDFGVGLAKIEILDFDTNEVLQVISGFDGRVMSYDFMVDGDFNGVLQVPASYLSGDEDKRLQLRVTDRLGHVTKGVTKDLDVDFVVPNIVTGSLNFTKLNGFIGPSSEVTDLTLEIEENNLLTEVSLFSDHISIPNDNLADFCELVGENLQRCTWQNARVESVDALTAKVTAVDKFQNFDEKTVSFTFARDVQAPIIDFVGSSRIFAETPYLTAEEGNVVIIRINEIGAGMDRDDVVLNFNNLGYNDEFGKSPDYCEQTETFDCYFENIEMRDTGSDREVEVKVVRLRDKVGNEGEHSGHFFRVDSTAPVVNKLEIMALNDLGERDHFQSEDKILIKANITEPSGLFFKINLNDVVLGADILYPATEESEAGWQVFTDESCEREGVSWRCEFLTSEKLKSEYQGNALIELEVSDSAGNVLRNTDWPEEYRSRVRSTNNRFFFKKLALDEDQDPNYWIINPSDVQPKVPFIDIETTNMISTRMAFDVNMKASGPAVSALSVELVACESDIPSQGRQVLWNNLYIDPQISPVTFNLVLEFLPFDSREYLADQLVGDNFKTADAEFTCTFHIFSKVGKKAIRAAEVETVVVALPFGFTDLGSEDEALQKTIDREKEKLRTGWWGFIGDIQIVLKIIEYLGSLVNLVFSIISAYDLGKAIYELPQIAYATALEKVPGGQGAAQASALGKLGFCLGSTGTSTAVGEVADEVRYWMSLFTCDLSAVCEGGALEFWSENSNPFDNIRCAVIRVYNLLSLSILDPEVNILGTTGFTDAVGLSNYGSGNTAETTAANPIDTAPDYGDYTYWNKASGGQNFEGDTLLGGGPAANVYDNLYLSIGTLCVPGVLHNVDKLRQIECRYIDCLETEVAQGIATVQACGELRDVMSCKYFYGALFQLIPFTGAWLSQFLDSIKALLLDPIAWVTTIAIYGCAINCLLSLGPKELPVMSDFCASVHLVLKVAGIVDNMVGLVKGIINDASGSADYCTRVLKEDDGPDEELSGGEVFTEPASSGERVPNPGPSDVQNPTPEVSS